VFHQESHPNARSLCSQFSRYNSSQSTQATVSGNCGKKTDYATELSLAFVAQQSFVTSTIIGAAGLDQLKEKLHIHVTPDDTLKAIDEVQALIPIRHLNLILVFFFKNNYLFEFSLKPNRK
jgi:aryl-alcohol dehydrogenase-like predicted oxidoreductase